MAARTIVSPLRLPAFVVAALVWGAASPARAGDAEDLARVIHGVGIDIGNVEARIASLDREIRNPVAKSRYYPLEKRLVDARVYFELKNYAKAAVLFLDATRYPSLATHPERSDVLYRLGVSLYRLGNFLSAREAFVQALATGNSTFQQQVLRHLLEIGLASRTQVGLEDAVARIGRLSTRSAPTEYAYGKGLYRVGRKVEAMASFRRVPAGAAEYSAAQYYLGVAHTGARDFDAALAAFARAAAAKPGTPRQKRVRELSQLALGRLHLELKHFEKATDAYQEIDRNSEHFHTALYEMTWAQIHQKEFDRALDSLDILLLTVKDDQLATEASILRGRLHIMLEQGDLAIETYNEIIQQFSPLRNELERIASKAPNLTAYFRWLLVRQTEPVRLGRVLTDQADRWIRSDPQLKGLLELFDEMALEKKDVGQALEIVRELEDALRAGNRIEIFPNLKNAWTRIVVTENTLMQLSERVLDMEGRLAAARMSADERTRHEALVAKRKALELRFAAVPKSESALRARKSQVGQRFALLRRESFMAEQGLKQVALQLEAMERWLREAREAETKLDKAHASALVAQLEKEKVRLKELYADLGRLKLAIDRQAAGVGAGDVVNEQEKTLRRDLRRIHEQESELLARVLSRLEGRERGLAEALSAHRRRIVAGFDTLATLLGRLDSAADRQIEGYRRQVAAEKLLLAGFKEQVERFNFESGAIARDIGAPLFRQAARRISDVVLEADLGLVDVAWKRKERETDRIRTLQKELSDQTERLEKTMKAILKE